MIDKNRTALVTGALLAGWHILWSAAVVLGLAQALIDFVFWMHFIKPVYVIEPFAITRFVVLVAVTGTVGAVLGYCFAAIWNRLHGSVQRASETQIRQV